MRYNELVFERSSPLFVRAILIGAGGFVLFISAKELGGGLYPFSFLSLFFGAIILGAWSVGGMFVLAGVFDASHSFRIQPDYILVESKGLYDKHQSIPSKNIRSIPVQFVDSETEPDRFRVVLKIAGRLSPLLTPTYATKEEAEKVRGRIIQRLGVKNQFD